MALTFRERLAKHLCAIQQRDLAVLAETLAERELVLIQRTASWWTRCRSSWRRAAAASP